MLPIIVVFLAFSPWIITLLYTVEFKAVVPLVQWGILGMLFKAVSFSLGYVIIARGDSSLFLRTTISFNTILFALNAAGYYHYGLMGLGMSFLVYYVIHFFSLIVIVKWRYDLTLSKGLYVLFGSGLVLCSAVLISAKSGDSVGQMIITAALIVITCLFSWYQLNQRTDVLSLIRTKKDPNSDEH